MQPGHQRAIHSVFMLSTQEKCYWREIHNDTIVPCVYRFIYAQSLIDKDTFAAKLGVSLARLPLVKGFLDDLTILEGVDGRIIDSPGIKNFVSYRTLKTGSRMLKAFGRSLADAVLVPIESHLFLLADNGIIGIGSDCGFEAYLAEKARVLQRHRLEAKTLLPTVRFEWSSPVDDEEFEKLIVELLTREPGVLRARKLGKAREPDFGRDILVEWYRAAEPPTSDNPIRLRRVTVQCKAFSRPVGKSQVRDILDLLSFHQATGYLLVSLSGVTKPLIEFLEKLNQRDSYWIDWWTRIEIEAKLRANPDIATRYSHLVEMTECRST